MAAGDEWRALVPREVAKVIDDIDGVNRIRDLTPYLRTRMEDELGAGTGEDG
jgi:hypothetical protein